MTSDGFWALASRLCTNLYSILSENGSLKLFILTKWSLKWSHCSMNMETACTDSSLSLVRRLVLQVIILFEDEGPNWSLSRSPSSTMVWVKSFMFLFLFSFSFSSLSVSWFFKCLFPSPPKWVSCNDWLDDFIRLHPMRLLWSEVRWVCCPETYRFLQRTTWTASTKEEARLCSCTEAGHTAPGSVFMFRAAI